MPKTIEAYVCKYCGGNLTSDYDSILKHEERCNLNPNKPYCNCALCVHGKVHHREDTGYQHRKIIRAYTTCAIGGKFDYLHNYCKSFIDERGE